jgi:hypothetical protein
LLSGEAIDDGAIVHRLIVQRRRNQQWISDLQNYEILLRA